MKKLLVVLAAVAMSTGAFAQKHMVNFDAGEIVGALRWDSSKEKGSSSTEDKMRGLTLNYAYTLTSYLQVGAKVNYFRNSGDGYTQEDYGFQVGAIYNHGSDIRSAYYASLYTGMDWQNAYEAGGSRDEILKTTVAVGKRFPLSFVNLENVVYSPELAWESLNPTKSSSTEWTQSLAVKFLNFSVFF